MHDIYVCKDVVTINGPNAHNMYHKYSTKGLTGEKSIRDNQDYMLNYLNMARIYRHARQ